MLLQNANASTVVGHNLEQGLSNEEAFRQLLRQFLPGRYGVAKGKIANMNGNTSRQCDVIIYDNIRCPKLFIDSNGNQILPIEGVFATFEVKTTLTKATLEEAFQNLMSIYKLRENRVNRSTNTHVNYCPPELAVISFGTTLKLETIARHYSEFSKAFPVRESFSAYSKASPGEKYNTGDSFLVSAVVVLGKGEVHHMFSGSVNVDKYCTYTLGVFLTGLVSSLAEVDLMEVGITNYFNWIMAVEALGGSSGNRQRFRKKFVCDG